MLTFPLGQALVPIMQEAVGHRPTYVLQRPWKCLWSLDTEAFSGELPQWLDWPMGPVRDEVSQEEAVTAPVAS